MDIAKSARNQAELHNDAPHRARRRRAYTALKLKSERAFKNLRFFKKNRGNPESCKPDSVVPERTDIHLSARLLNRAPLAGVRHTRDVMDEQPRLLHCLAPNWVYHARRGCPRRRWALTPPFHPCRCALRRIGGLFSVALSMRHSCKCRPVFSNGVPLCGVRTFLPRKNRERMSTLQFFPYNRKIYFYCKF